MNILVNRSAAVEVSLSQLDRRNLATLQQLNELAGILANQFRHGLLLIQDCCNAETAFAAVWGTRKSLLLSQRWFDNVFTEDVGHRNRVAGCRNVDAGKRLVYLCHRVNNQRKLLGKTFDLFVGHKDAAKAGQVTH